MLKIQASPRKALRFLPAGLSAKKAMVQRIEIFAQYGALDSGAAISPFTRLLNQIFGDQVKGHYFDTLEKFAIFFRVSGSICKFRGGGPERPRIVRKRRAITVDLVIPENRWKDATSHDLQTHISQQLRRCFELLLTRAQKEQELINEAEFVADFERAMQSFETTIRETSRFHLRVPRQ